MPQQLKPEALPRKPRDPEKTPVLWSQCAASIPSLAWRERIATSEHPGDRIALCRHPMQAREVINHPAAVEAAKAGILLSALERTL